MDIELVPLKDFKAPTLQTLKYVSNTMCTICVL